jgi:1-aminocyclopropane-1-carboxylate deaminase/D-cysteine desulfhydrase-like pyridoxal-dependent ACC family enzyme
MLTSFARLALGVAETPLHVLPRLSTNLRRQIAIKRDDFLGPAPGGGVTRKLEYLLAPMNPAKNKRFVTVGGCNDAVIWTMATTLRMLGHQPCLLIAEWQPTQILTGLRRARSVGARICFLPPPLNCMAGLSLEQCNQRLTRFAQRLFGPAIVLPLGASAWPGTLGAVQLAFELDTQARQAGTERAWVILPSATGGTLAGLLAGFQICRSQLRPLAVGTQQRWHEHPASIAVLTNTTLAHLQQPANLRPVDIPLIEQTYATTTSATLAAQRQLLHTEGIVLDPQSSAKAMAAMLDLIQRGRIADNDPLIFLHTSNQAELLTG